MSKDNSDNDPHIAQQVFWWVSSASLICAGIWAVFVYFNSTSIEQSHKDKNNSITKNNISPSNTTAIKKFINKSATEETVINNDTVDSNNGNCKVDNPPISCLWR